MTKLEQLTRKIIEARYGCKYEECEGYKEPIAGGAAFIHSPITIGVVMQALQSVNAFSSIYDNEIGIIIGDKEAFGRGIMAGYEQGIQIGYAEIIKWKLTKEYGQECTLEDQSKDTIDKLLELLKK